MTADAAHALGTLRVRRHGLSVIGLSVALVAAAVMLWLGAAPAAAQYADGGIEPRKKQYAPASHARKRRPAPRGNAPHDWGGFALDLTVTRPLNSHLLITNGQTRVGLFNLTGIHIAATAAYLFQEGHFVLGPRAKLTGGWIGSMPFDYTVRTNASLTLGGEGGIALGQWYFYAFVAGGGALISAERVGMGRADNTVPAYELGAGFRFALPQRWYAKTEFVYTTLGDQRLGNESFDAKPYYALTAGFGFQFTTR